jgi:hypothetical protein
MVFPGHRNGAVADTHDEIPPRDGVDVSLVGAVETLSIKNQTYSAISDSYPSPLSTGQSFNRKLRPLRGLVVGGQAGNSMRFLKGWFQSYGPTTQWSVGKAVGGQEGGGTYPFEVDRENTASRVSPRNLPRGHTIKVPNKPCFESSMQQNPREEYFDFKCFHVHISFLNVHHFG